MNPAFDDQVGSTRTRPGGVHLVENRLVRFVWGVMGTVSLAFGLIGVVVPGWPTTIFLIIAAACYARSSQRMYDRILANPVFGPHVRRFRETGGMPMRAKVVALSVMWPFVLFSVTVAIPWSMHWAQALVLTVALVGTAYIISRPTDRPTERAARSA
ncbi:MAG: YbaN family protein [Dehalococcoidia bacterium]